MASLTGRRVAVMGGTGFIGSHLVERLVRDGADVLAVARSTSRFSNLASVRSDCTLAVADLRDADSTIGVLRRFRPEIVFHLAAHPDGTESFAHVAECVRTNGLGLINTLQAAVTAGASVLVYGASAKEYGNAAIPYHVGQRVNPVCSYAIIKAAGWQLCQLVSSFAPISTVALRPTFVYGPRQNRNVISYVQECVRDNRPVKLMGGSQTRDPLYIDDAVNAFVIAAANSQSWGHAIPIGGGVEVGVTALCESVVTALGATVPVVVGAEPPRATEIWRSSADNMDAQRLLGWQPEVPLAEGIKRTVTSWQPAARSAMSDMASVPRSRADAYMQADARGVVYRMLDRREVADRRSLWRGGRRREDLRAAESAVAMAHNRHASPANGHVSQIGEAL